MRRADIETRKYETLSAIVTSIYKGQTYRKFACSEWGPLCKQFNIQFAKLHQNVMGYIMGGVG